MGMMKLGPVGDCRDRISHIFVSFDDKYLTSIQFGYVKNGAVVLSKKHGSSNSTSTRIVRLNHVSEFVTGISRECYKGFRIISNKKREFHSGMHDRREFAGFFGSCSSYRLYSIGLYLKPILPAIRLNQDEYVTGLSAIHWGAALTSLTFHTNQRKHGPICERFDDIKDGYMKEIDVGICDPREFGGFFGSFCHVSGYLTSIGLYVCPITRINDAALKTNYKVTDDDDDQLTVYQSSGPLTTINHNRTLEYQMPHEIISIQFGYIENGALVMSAKYGGDFKGQSFRVVKLKHNEYVTGLSGCGGINSLTFYTNLGKHGPICEPKLNVTNIKTEIDLAICDRREFGGFFGSCNQYSLTSIGIYVNPIPSSNTAVKRENV
ncbi:unnamed protein product [Arabidopsis arenosa]|uniref:Jacalin-type lectin domain-containing protein n=1 Tax=Arabidopsis arenosa TaxID=38785 RepID=A0A8S2A755_ARAAE|nr:unnamed protein product [Arabidopsis arenosa]